MPRFPAFDEAGEIAGTLETVQIDEDTLFFSYIGYGLQRTGGSDTPFKGTSDCFFRQRAFHRHYSG